MENILLALTSKYFAPLAVHPMLIPSLSLLHWFDFNNMELENARQELTLRQKTIGSMEKKFE
jgi:hypothetical protein